ncbi:MAG: hypothetical protein ACYDHY_15005 [Acidiferrobacterales bacterium]
MKSKTECTYERLGNGDRICTKVLAWRSRLDDCCGTPAPKDLQALMESAPECILFCGNCDDIDAWARLSDLNDYQKRACSR